MVAEEDNGKVEDEDEDALDAVLSTDDESDEDIEELDRGGSEAKESSREPTVDFLDLPEHAQVSTQFVHAVACRHLKMKLL